MVATRRFLSFRLFQALATVPSLNHCSPGFGDPAPIYVQAVGCRKLHDTFDGFPPRSWGEQGHSKSQEEFSLTPNCRIYIIYIYNHFWLFPAFSCQETEAPSPFFPSNDLIAMHKASLRLGEVPQWGQPVSPDGVWRNAGSCLAISFALRAEDL